MAPPPSDGPGSLAGVPLGIPRARLPRCPAHRGERARTTCRGCGLFLCAQCLAASRAEGVEERCFRCRAPTPEYPIPWEDPSRSKVQGFLQTLRQLFSPDRFFSGAPWTGGLKGPLGFAVLAAFLGALVKGVFDLISTGMMAASLPATVAQLTPILKGMGPQAGPLVQELPKLAGRLSEVMLVYQVASLALNPLSTAMGVFVMAALSHPIARYLGGQGSFEGTFRVVAYATAAELLGAIPLIGSPLAFLAGIVLTTVGMRRAHGLSGGRALLVATWWLLAGILFVVLAFPLAMALVLRMAAG